MSRSALEADQYAAAVLLRLEMLQTAIASLGACTALRHVAEAAATLDPSVTSKRDVEAVATLAKGALRDHVELDPQVVHDSAVALHAVLGDPVFVRELSRAFGLRRGHYVDETKREAWCLRCGRVRVLSLDGATTCGACVIEAMGAP